ncbi:MAG TPA: glycoside hydrolase family 88 protein [Phycisphaerae bacterium]|nr:glycoside hydrolase family 88 protein [Phycisphaerae bacterium]
MMPSFIPRSVFAKGLWARAPHVLAAVCLVAGAASLRAADGPAPSEVSHDPARILSLMEKMADAQLAQYGDKPPADWIAGAFYTGLAALYGAELGHNHPQYLEAAVAIADKYDWSLQPVGSPRIAHADNDCIGQLYIDLALIKNDPSKLDNLIKQMDRVVAGYDNPTPENQRAWAVNLARDGKPMPWWWCDSFFMAPPTLTRLSAVTGDPKYIDAMDKQWWITTAKLYDKDEHLFYRDGGFINQKTPNGKKVFWGRGNGWVVAGLAHVLAYMPKDYPSRPKYEALFKDMCEKLRTLQPPDGMWRVSLLDPESAPAPESSASAFFCFAFTWGINHGLLDRTTFEPAARKAFDALAGHILPSGLIGSVQKVSDRPQSVEPDASMPYAVGGFLLSGAEMIRLDDAKK